MLAQAAWRPASGRHNIWEIAVHAADAGWKSDLGLLDVMHDALRMAVELSAKDRSRTPPGKKVTNFAFISGVAGHDLYHAGQIQILKRLARV